MPSRRSRRRRRRSRPNLGRAFEARLRVALELRERGELEAEAALRLVVWPPPGRLEEARYVHAWAPEVREEAVELYRSGYSLPAVEQALGVSAGTVKVWLFEAGCRRDGVPPRVLAS